MIRSGVFGGPLNRGGRRPALALDRPARGVLASAWDNFRLVAGGFGAPSATYYFADGAIADAPVCEALAYFSHVGPGAPLWYNAPLKRWRAFRPDLGADLRPVMRPTASALNVGVFGLAFSYTFRGAA